jgi:hypothetical protein
MSWNPRSVTGFKQEFLELALQDGAMRRELCRRFGIDPNHDGDASGGRAMEALPTKAGTC